MSSPTISPDGNWQWDGQQWQPRQPDQVAIEKAANKQSRRVLFGVVGGLIAVSLIVWITVAVAGSGSGTKAPAKPAATAQPTTRPTAAPTAKPTAAPVAPKVLLDQTGTGNGETTQFDSNGHFTVTYSVSGNSLFGSPGNFVITPIDANGNALAGAEVNRLVADGSGTAEGYTFGTQKGMRLQVFATGNGAWHVTVTQKS
jgi:hypothetical protein